MLAVPRDTPLRIVTDSRHVVDGMNEWRAAWKRKRWQGFKLVNLPEFRALSDAVDARTASTVFQWIKGHRGHAGNEAADALAGAGAEKDY